jgi:hypothetical protein
VGVLALSAFVIMGGMAEPMQIPPGEEVFIGAPPNPLDPEFVESLAAYLRQQPLVSQAYLPQVHFPRMNRTALALVVVFNSESVASDQIEPVCHAMIEWLNARLASDLFVWPMKSTSNLLAVVRGYVPNIASGPATGGQKGLIGRWWAGLFQKPPE